jgi:hypothetical protein
MDIYGIGNSLDAFAQTLSVSARRTGRTEMMINSLKDGDQVVFSDAKECERVRRRLKELNIDAKCVVDSNRHHPVENMRRASGKTVFDHGWVEQFYNRKLSSAKNQLAWLQKELSGEPIQEPEWPTMESDSFKDRIIK